MFLVQVPKICLREGIGKEVVGVCDIEIASTRGGAGDMFAAVLVGVTANVVGIACSAYVVASICRGIMAGLDLCEAAVALLEVVYSCLITLLVREGDAIVILEGHFGVVRKLCGTVDTCVGHAQTSNGQWDELLVAQPTFSVTCILSQRVLDELWDEMAAIRRRPEIYLECCEKALL